MDIQATDERTNTVATDHDRYAVSKRDFHNPATGEDNPSAAWLTERAHPDVPGWETTNGELRLSACRAGRIVTVNSPSASVPA